jgi:cyclase
MRLRFLALLIGVVLGAVGMYVYRQAATFDTVQVSPDSWMIVGADGGVMVSSNVAVLKTAAGPIVVDTMTFPFHGRWIRRFAGEVAGGAVQAVINTHHHQDHTHGNPAFDAGTRVVSTVRAREHLVTDDAEFWQGEAAALLPNETFADDHVIQVGGKTIRLVHLGRGHTDGDLVALFVEDRVLVTGDLVWNRHYPNIDLEAGGSLPAWDATLDRVLELEFDKVIPGHGAVMDREGVRGFQSFLRELWQVGTAAAREHKSLEETLASAQLTTDIDYRAVSLPFVITLDRDFVITRAWQEATGAVKADGR